MDLNKPCSSSMKIEDKSEIRMPSWVVGVNVKNKHTSSQSAHPKAIVLVRAF